MSAGEFALIDRFVRAFPRARGALTLGPGDDAALLRPARGEELVFTTDALVEGVHFARAFRDADIGHKALAVNLSDLAAMGARPLAFLCALALPLREVKRLDGIARGMSTLAENFGCQLAGGNFTRAKELSITITAIGAVPRGRALRRDGARPGDLICVSGSLGGAAAGLRRGASGALVRKQRRPEPQIALGLRARALAHAALDISDGFAQDLAHLCRASNVGAHVDVARIPIARGATLNDALFGGEDYELLLALPAKDVQRLPVCVVGEVTRARAITGLPARRALGHDHFRAR